MRPIASVPPLLLAVSLAACASAPQARHEVQHTSTPGTAAPTPPGPPLAYPATRTVEAADTFHGTVVPDPFRWLHQTDDPEVRAWVDAQDALAVAFLESTPEHERIRRRLSELQPRRRYGLPTSAAGRYFYRFSDGTRPHAVLLWRQGLDGEPRVLLDPNTFSADGSVPLRAISVSPDGRLVAYGRGIGGTWQQDVHVHDVETGRDLPDLLRRLPHTELTWTRDSRGFFYGRSTPAAEATPTRPRGYALFYHRVGTPEAEDVLVLGSEDGTLQPPFARVTSDGRYLGITLGGGEQPNAFYYLDLGDAADPRLDGEIVRLIDGFDARYRFLGSEGSVFFFRTDLDAPRGRVIAVDTRRPERQHWRTVVSAGDDVLDVPVLVGGRLFVSYLSDASTRIRVFTSAGEPLHEVELPELSESWQFWGEPDGDELFYRWQSFLTPVTISRYDLRSGRSSVFLSTEVDFDASPYVTTRRFFTSRDGTRVPMFVTHRRELVRDGRNPTYMIGYGGGGLPWGPHFASQSALWLERGGVLVLANIRGGGEYGEEWFLGGSGANKQNTFDDFIAAAEALIADGTTSPEKLAVYGISRGGLLMGAVLNQRPDLFAAAIVDRGVMDMVHLFPRGLTAELGSLNDAEDFARIHGYSPYHNLRPGTCYPATLTLAGDDDDAAPPAHSYKYVAAKQAAQGCARPALLRLYRGTGHGSAALVGEEWDQTTEVQIRQWTDVFAFLDRVLGGADRRVDPVPISPRLRRRR
jgi:prolyl oligopeptidase